MDIKNWKKNMVMGERLLARAEITKVLTPGQIGQLSDEFKKLVQTAEIDDFKKFATLQKTPLWCWAACIQMLLNYNGIPWDQEKIAEDIKGTTIPDVASPKEIEKVTGWRLNPKDPRKGWSANSVYWKGTPPDDMVVGLLSRNRMILVGVDRQHLCVLYKAHFRELPSGFELAKIFLFDPLEGTDIVLTRQEFRNRVGDWWEIHAVSSPTRVF